MNCQPGRRVQHTPRSAARQYHHHNTFAPSVRVLVLKFESPLNLDNAVLSSSKIVQLQQKK